MPSHSYEFNGRDVMRIIAPSLVPVVAFAAAMHLGTRLGLLPKPRPTLDIDRTILVHKAEAARAHRDAEILLIGDSSCMIDVVACELGALNLGSVSYLGLDSHAELLRKYFAINTSRVHAVVLLMHPEALRLASPAEYHANVLKGFLRGEDFALRSSPRDYVSYWLGFDFFRPRLLARYLPLPLGGPYGRRYGFTRDLEKFLDANCGGLADPERRSFQGNREYRLAARLEKQSRTFRAAIPGDIKLLVGITPIPESHSPPDYAATRQQMLTQWQQWLAPATILDLPATLPDNLFMSVTHLSTEGANQYTATVRNAIRERPGERLKR